MKMMLKDKLSSRHNQSVDRAFVVGSVEADVPKRGGSLVDKQHATTQSLLTYQQNENLKMIFYEVIFETIAGSKALYIKTFCSYCQPLERSTHSTLHTLGFQSEHTGFCYSADKGVNGASDVTHVTLLLNTLSTEITEHGKLRVFNAFVIFILLCRNIIHHRV